jgi:AraC-like DNA-binding protein
VPETTYRIPLSRVSEFSQIIDAIEACGTSPERLLRRLHIPMWHHCQPDGFLPINQIYRLAHHAARSVGLETFGVRAMELIPFQRMGRVGELVAASPTVFQALVRATRLLPAHGTAKQWWLAEGDDEIWFCRGGGGVFNVGEGQLIQHALTGMVQLVRLGAGPHWRPSKVRVNAASTLGLETTERFADARIMPDPAISAIAIPRPVLGLPLSRIARSHASSGELSEETLLASAPADEFAGALRQVIRTLLSEGYPPIELAAEVTGLHVRTLQRRLTREGVTYKHLVDQARIETAALSLSNPNATVTGVAFDLGYSDVAHFTRAFRRWFGASPRQYRRLRLGS